MKTRAASSDENPEKPSASERNIKYYIKQAM